MPCRNKAGSASSAPKTATASAPRTEAGRDPDSRELRDLNDGDGTIWLEPVTDEQYQQANQH